MFDSDVNSPNSDLRAKSKFRALSLVQPSASTMQLWADRLGLCLSVACLIHCLATPVLLIALPSLSYLVAEHDHGHSHAVFHEVLLAILPLLAVLAFIPGYRMHRKREVFYWAFPGIVALAVGVLLSHETPLLATLITIAGSGLLVRAHLLNRKECACCKAGHGQHGSSKLSRPQSVASKVVTSKTVLTSVPSTSNTK